MSDYDKHRVPVSLFSFRARRFEKARVYEAAHQYDHEAGSLMLTTEIESDPEFATNTVRRTRVSQDTSNNRASPNGLCSSGQAKTVPDNGHDGTTLPRTVGRNSYDFTRGSAGKTEPVGNAIDAGKDIKLEENAKKKGGNILDL